MAEKKAAEVDRYLARPDPGHCVVLIYGPDTGLVSERARILAAASGAALDDPFSTVKLDADEAASDPARLASEAHTVSMFGGKRLIWVRGSTQRNLVAAVEPVLSTPPQDCLVIIEAGDLKKSAPLRSRIEKCATAVALPCYGDMDKGLDSIIDEELGKAELAIAPEARRLLKSLLGDDRMASRGEVAKLALYCAGNSRVAEEDVLAIVGDASALAIDSLVDAAGSGDMATVEQTYRRLLARGTSPVQIVLAMQRHFQMLHSVRAEMDKTRTAANAIIGKLRPPLHFQRRDHVARTLSKWSLPAFTRALARIDRASLECRANADLSEAIAATTLMAITIEGARSGR